jgi:vancomycin resistance protein YoaR
MTAETVDSVGGGICQVSSSLYNAALSAGLTIVERHAHYTLVASVPPGLDATVWYGQADLRLQNPYPWPIQLQVDVSQERLIVGIAGKHAVPSASIQREQEWLDPQHLQVSVYQGSQRLSQDRYVVTHVNKKTTNLSGH